MTEERAKRKLSAVLSADVKGYSRLMGRDEAGTVNRLKEYRTLMTGLIRQYGGRVVDFPGDNILAEFVSVVDATECSVKIQEELKPLNADLPEEKRMEFRIGINLGDVIEDGERIYGDGVNIAARIEGLAEGGGICISGTSYDQVKNKLNLGYENLGEHSVKNIAEPVRVYRVLTEPEAAGKVISEKRKTRKWIALAAAVLLIVAVGGVASWFYYLRQSSKIETASVAKLAYPLPDKPSIAVLPFTNMSGDPEQEYFSDGLTEEIITALSKTPRLLVIARHSAFTYKEKSAKVQQVGRELGVRYLLKGSVRKSGDKVRITAQLIDATTDKHIWAERYDRDLKHIFAIQDEITLEIINALQVKLTEGEKARVTGRGTKNLDAYLKAIQAHEQMRRTHNKENSLRVRQLAMEAISLDPHYGYPYAILSQAHLRDKWLPSTESPEESMRLATDAAQKALALDDSDYRIHITLGFLYVNQGKYDKAVAAAQRAVELCPGGSDAYKVMGTALDFACRTSQAIPMFEEAIKLNPLPDATLFYLLAAAYQWVGRYGDAIIEGKKALQLNPNNALTHFVLVRAYTKLGRKEEARAEAAKVLRNNPKFSLDWYFKMAVKMMPAKCHSKFYDDIEFVRKADVGLK